MKITFFIKDYDTYTCSYFKKEKMHQYHNDKHVIF